MFSSLLHAASGNPTIFLNILTVVNGDDDKPLYDYEEIIFDLLVTQNGNKHIWINKATGLGVSEFMLRYMAWLCLKDNALSGSQMCIVTGPRIDLAIALIDRMKNCSPVVKVLLFWIQKKL